MHLESTQNTRKIVPSVFKLFSPLPNTIKNLLSNGTAHFKNLNNCLNTNIYSYLETSGGQNSNLYLYAVHFFNTSVN